MKRITGFFLGLLLIAVFTLPAVAGTLTTNKFFYKPDLGARGDLEKKAFDAGLDRIDARLGREIWLGDPNFGTTLQTAIAAIGSSPAILRIPVGTYAVAKNTIIPATTTLKFENGGTLDLSALLDAPIEAMTTATACQVTVTNHGLQTGDYLRIYGIRQGYVSGATHAGEWLQLNDYVYQVTVIDANNFTIPVNTSSFHAYVPATDPGRLCVPLIIKGKIEAGKQKIFNISAPAQVIRATSGSDLTNSPQTDFFPEWFGAKGDGVTDDLLALKACLKAMIYSSLPRGTMHLSTWYAVSDTFSINELIFNTGSINIEGQGRTSSGLLGLASCDGHPIMEVVGTACPRFKTFGLKGVKDYASNNVAQAPSVALLLARSQYNPNGGGGIIEDVGFYGYFRYGCIYDYGFATIEYRNLESNAGATTDALWAFNVAIVGGSITTGNPFPAIVPTNSDYETWGNASADGVRLFNSYFVATGTKAAGNAGIYLNGAQEPIIENVACGGQYDYWLYALNTAVNIKGCGGDGNGAIAGVYVCSSSPQNQKVTLSNYINNKAGAVTLMTDANTTLDNSIISRPQGNNGYSISLGGSAQYSRFDCTDSNLTSFTAAGTFIGCDVVLPLSCTNFSIPAGGYGNHIRRIMSNGKFQWLDGDVQIGQPGQSAISNLFLDQVKLTHGPAAPTSGSWAQGSIIINDAAVAGGVPGWICVLNNTFGTLNSGNTTGSITTGTKLLTVSSVTGLTIGNFIDVVADGGGNAVSKGRIVNIDSTNKLVTLAANASATATSQAVSYHNETTAAAFMPLPSGARSSGVTGAIATGATITHSLGLTPTKVLLQSVDGVPTGIYPSALGATTFVINFAGGGSHTFYWEAIQ